VLGASECRDLKSKSCDVSRGLDEKSGGRGLRDRSLFDFNKLPRQSGACAVAVPRVVCTKDLLPGRRYRAPFGAADIEEELPSPHDLSTSARGYGLVG
jgi:hypothetical protein